MSTPLKSVQPIAGEGELVFQVESPNMTGIRTMREADARAWVEDNGGMFAPLLNENREQERYLTAEQMIALGWLSSG